MSRSEQLNSSTPEFRRDLQGLRALAVIMVLLFHFELLGADGGFAGVDVFFVLSGFLMTKILIRRETQSGWSLYKGFLSKRFWRIAPAYYLVVLVSLIGGWFVLLPADYAKLAESAGSTIPFLSNYYFRSQAGYFEGAATYKLLLHTWSLAVEMQFYLIWPAAFLVIRRFSYALQALALAVAILASWSFAYMFIENDSELVFFGVLSRIWQFGAGAVLATPWLVERLPRRAIQFQPLQFVALATIISSTFLMSEQLTWPVPWAIFPTVATMVLIGGNLTPANGAVYRILSLSPLVWIGEISYSLYLVHWPIVCMIYIIWWPDADIWTRVAGLALSVPLAWGLHRFVENPMRYRGKSSSILTRDVLTMSTMLLTILVFGVTIIATSGVPQRFRQEIRPVIMGETRWRSSLPTPVDCTALQTGCTNGGNGKPTLFLWGDSHAGTMLSGLSILAHERGFNFSSQIASACPPGPDISSAIYNRTIDLKCLDSNKRAIEKLAEIENLQAIVLVARWALYATTFDTAGKAGQRFYTVRSNAEERHVSGTLQNLQSALNQLATKMRDRKTDVIILTQLPEFNDAPARCYQNALWAQKPDSICKIPQSQVETRQLSYRRLLQKTANAHPNVKIVETNHVFCNSTGCSGKLEGEVAYRDDDHLIAPAALHMLRQLKLPF